MHPGVARASHRSRQTKHGRRKDCIFMRARPLKCVRDRCDARVRRKVRNGGTRGSCMLRFSQCSFVRSRGWRTCALRIVSRAPCVTNSRMSRSRWMNIRHGAHCCIIVASSKTNCASGNCKWWHRPRRSARQPRTRVRLMIDFSRVLR